MAQTLIARRDMDFLLHEWLRVGELDRGTVDAFIDLSEKLAIDHFLNHYKGSDIEEPVLASGGVRIYPAIGEALTQYAKLGLFAASFSEDLGGLGIPHLVCAASFAYFAAANIATAAYPMLTVANARLISTFGTPAQIEQFARPQIEGRWFGTMCLSEPQAGSSLADIRTRATLQGSDRWGQRFRLHGNKMWISGGDQDVSENIVHLVLAKIPDEAGAMRDGTAGLSLFIVPKYLPDGTRNDVIVAGLNHKLGYRGTANCLLNFGEGEGAVGWIIGKQGQGLRQMFRMMNEARIAVGLGAAALGYRAYRLSAEYARERLQGRSFGQRSGPLVAIIEHPDVKRMLLAQKAYAEGALALCLYCANLMDQRTETAESLLGLLTPVAKTWASEYGLAANDIAIQVHGGYGYTREFAVEQLWRDNRLNPIHEGTTGIQAIDLVGRKIVRDGRALSALDEVILKTARRAASVESLADFSAALQRGWEKIDSAIQTLRQVDERHVLDNATPFLWAFGHLVVAWLWLDQALAAGDLEASRDSEGAFALGKLRTCRYFYECELPRVGPWLALVASTSDIAANAPTEMF
jgi:alkylation response protein AidB-like acyl-CoA dehydrogenase